MLLLYFLGSLNRPPECIGVAPGAEASRVLVELMAAVVALDDVFCGTLLDVDALVAVRRDCVSTDVV